MSDGRAFFDTNIFLYTHSPIDPKKRARATQLLQENLDAGTVVLSTQVVQEFYSVASRKMMLPASNLRRAVQALLNMPIIQIRGEHILAAIDNQTSYRISFWDGLIIAAAESAGAEILYTEDLNDGQRYGSIVVRNPFRA